MEEITDLEAYAEDIIARAEEVLTTPKHIDVSQEFTHRFSDEYSGVWRTQGTTRDDGSPFNRNLRYFYLHGSHEKNGCYPTVSLDIGVLVVKGEIQGHRVPEGADELRSAIEQAGDPDHLAVDYLRIVYAMLADEIRGRQVNPGSVIGQDRVFTDLIEEGLTFTTKTSIENNGKVGMVLRSGTPTGDLSLQDYRQERDPRIKISAKLTGDDFPDQTVLSQSSHGELESFEEIANPIERVASYVDEEKIWRDDEGKVIGVTGDLRAELAIIEAERAIGARALKAPQLKFVDDSLKELFNV